MHNQNRTYLCSWKGAAPSTLDLSVVTCDVFWCEEGADLSGPLSHPRQDTGLTLRCSALALHFAAFASET